MPTSKRRASQKFLAVSEYRRQRQLAYNQEHNITPRSVSRAVEESLSSQDTLHKQAHALLHETNANFDVTETIRELEEEMLTAANNLEFEKAALLRDQIRELKRATGDAPKPGEPQSRRVTYGKGKHNKRKAGVPG